jgi:hypothetical protein
MTKSDALDPNIFTYMCSIQAKLFHQTHVDASITTNKKEH